MDSNQLMALSPELTPRSHLYFDSRRQRWILTAPNQLVMPDPLSLDILLCCDGEHATAEIADGLDRSLHELAAPSREITAEIVSGFMQRGFLKVA
ncbi:hypothetical protein [Marinobacterium jannaschii]|uniref:hypothetical protein n=1 Tax=Marinobacterium jannaschii TaxID=64970 RepID=UPI000A7BAC83|nr:hypothetical protein [Marinobacterium jannaschii]